MDKLKYKSNERKINKIKSMPINPDEASFSKLVCGN